MLEDKRDFELSLVEFECLSELASCDESVIGLLKLHEYGPCHQVTIQLRRVEAEQLRDFLTTQLAILGFDENYSLNREGHIIERLIDRFYIPSR
jgi:hypothetical protein